MSRVLVLVAWALAGCGGDPCDGVAGACLALHVDSPSLRRVDALQVDITFGNDRGHAVTRRSDGVALDLPVATAVALGSISAPLPLRVIVTGLLGGAGLGRGEIATIIAPGEHASARLTLTGAEGADGGGDLGPDGAADLARTCTPGRLVCGGDGLVGDANTLYTCPATGTPTPRGTCIAGCLVRPGQDDACNAANAPCVTGDYCGGDKVVGDPQSLYRCDPANGNPLLQKCANGCAVRAGQNDVCF